MGGCALHFTCEVIQATQQGGVGALSGQDTLNHKILPLAVRAVIYLHPLSGTHGREPDADSLPAAPPNRGERGGQSHVAAGSPSSQSPTLASQSFNDDHPVMLIMRMARTHSLALGDSLLGTGTTIMNPSRRLLVYS